MSLRVVFMGSPDLAVPILIATHESFNVIGVVTQPDKPKGRGRKPAASAIKTAALEQGLPVSEPKSPADPEFIDLLQQWSPDVIVLAAYGKLLPKTVLEVPPMGCVNLHPSLLPRHRGPSPIAFAILSGDRNTGISTMLMDEGMDTGDILLQEEIPVREDDTTESLTHRIMEPSAQLVVKTLTELASGTLQPRSQDHEKATYSKLFSKEDGHINWNNDAVSLSRQIRALNPWPTAQAIFEGTALRFWHAVSREGVGAPGCIVELSDDGILVGTGNGLLLATEVQAAGKKRMHAADFARGKRLSPGTVFESAPAR